MVVEVFSDGVTRVFAELPIVSVGPPTMSLLGFEEVLHVASSPAAPYARRCYEAIVEYGVDPAFALAIFCHESTYGKKGWAARTRNWGNLRRGSFADYHQDCFAWYHGADAWIRSARDAARLLRKYADERMSFSPCGRHAEHKTALAIFEHWAPAGPPDYNQPAAYANHVERLVRTFREHWPVDPPGPSLEEVVKEIVRQLSELNRRVPELEARVEALEERV